MEIVGPRLHQNIYHRPAVAAKLRREAVVLHLEFLNHLGRRHIALTVGCPLPLFRTGRQIAIQPDFRRAITLSVGGKGGSEWIVIRVVQLRNPSRQIHQVVGVAALQRHPADELVRNIRAQR